jgi:hypothetical protein
VRRRRPERTARLASPELDNEQGIEEGNPMRKFVLKAALAASLAVSATGLGVGAAPASAAVINSQGCLEWNSTDGCVVRQYCSLDTTARYWSCISWDTRTKTGVSQNGVY